MGMLIGASGWLKMLDRYRRKVDFFLEPIAKKINMEANYISYLSLIFAIISAIFIYFSFRYHYFLFFSSFSVLINGFLDAIDGKIARIRKKESKKGDFIDHAIDRFSDAFIIGGIAISQWCNKFIGIAAVIAVLLTSYMGTQAQAIGYKRVYGGLLGRADRLIILFISIIIQYFVLKIYSFYFIEWVMLYFIFAGIITIVQRYYSIIKWLEMG